MQGTQADECPHGHRVEAATEAKRQSVEIGRQTEAASLRYTCKKSEKNTRTLPQTIMDVQKLPVLYSENGHPRP